MARRGPKPKAKPLKRPKNRYQRWSKLSERQFLEVLSGFAHEKPPSQIASKARVSEKSTRAILWKLRFKMLEAVMNNKAVFKGVRLFLLDGGNLLERGQAFLDDVGDIDKVRQYTDSRSISRRSMNERHYSAIIIELAVREFCRMSGYPVGLSELSDELMQIYKAIHKAGVDLDVPIDEGNVDEFGELVEDNAELLKQADEVREAEQNYAIGRVYRPYLSPNQTIYYDLRKYLIQNPL